MAILLFRQFVMLIKSFIVIAFLLIVFNLGSALFHLVKRKNHEQSHKTAKALTYRIVLSILLFILIFLAYAFGLIKPEGIGVRMHQQQEQSQTQP